MKKDAHSKRLELWIRYLHTGERKRGALPALEYPESLGEPIRGVMKDWRSEMSHSLKERADSLLFKEPIAEPIRRAFDEFGLNPSNPFVWRLLIFVFAEVHFGSHRSAAGAPTKWTATRWCDLLFDFNQMQARHPKASEAAICGYLKRDRELQHRYSDISPATIRRNLQYARDPERNAILKMRAELFAQDTLLVSANAAPARHEETRQKAVNKALQHISTAWKRRAKNKT
jgi:hypothetical protein